MAHGMSGNHAEKDAFAAMMTVLCFVGFSVLCLSLLCGDEPGNALFLTAAVMLLTAVAYLLPPS
jgi:hypothetical protein